jgi:hypothetical protein
MSTAQLPCWVWASGFEPAAHDGQKSPAHLPEARGPSVEVIESLSPLLGHRKIKEVSSVLLDTPVVNRVFNRGQYNFVIGPIPVLYDQAADRRLRGCLADRGLRDGFFCLKQNTKVGWHRDGLSGLAGSRRARGQPRISELGYHPKDDPNASQRRNGQERFAISKLSSAKVKGRRLNVLGSLLWGQSKRSYG